MNMRWDRFSPYFVSSFSSNYRLKSFSISAVLKINLLKKSICKIVIKEKLHFFSKLVRGGPKPLLKINYFTDILWEFCLDFKQCCNSFINFQNIYFTESLLITASDSSAMILCNDLHNMILNASRNCLTH